MGHVVAQVADLGGLHSMSATRDEQPALSAEVRQLHARRKAHCCTSGGPPEPVADPPLHLISDCRAKGGPYHTRHNCEQLCIDHQIGSLTSN